MTTSLGIQDPTLFTGTIRSNLDPFEKYTDDEMWYALEKVHLKDAVQSMGGLDASVAECTFCIALPEVCSDRDSHGHLQMVRT